MRIPIARLMIPCLALLAIAGSLAAADHVGVRLPPYREITLDNGGKLLLAERHDVPLIAFTAYLRGGALADPSGKEGVASITADLLEKGAGKRTAQQFAEAVDSVGGNLSTSAGREATIVRGEFLSRDRDLMIELVRDMLRAPSLEAGELVKVRDRSIDSIKAAKDSDLRALIRVYADAFLFGTNPYGRAQDGDETSLSLIERKDVLEYYRNNFGGDRLILAVVGDFDTRKMEQSLRAAFGDWRKAEAKAPSPRRAQPVSGRRVLLVDKPDATQTYFWIGNVGVPRNDPQMPAIDIANTVFGGRFTSMINTALRIESGLTYGARSRLDTPTEAGSVGISSYTKTDTTGKAVDMALDVLAKYEKEGIPSEMLDSAKSYILGQFPPDLETGSQLAAKLAELEFYRLGREDVDQYAAKISSASQEEVNRVIRRLYPTTDNLTFVFIGNADAIRDVVKTYGTVKEMKITDPRFAPKNKS